MSGVPMLLHTEEPPSPRDCSRRDCRDGISFAWLGWEVQAVCGTCHWEGHKWGCPMVSNTCRAGHRGCSPGMVGELVPEAGVPRAGAQLRTPPQRASVGWGSCSVWGSWQTRVCASSGLISDLGSPLGLGGPPSPRCPCLHRVLLCLGVLFVPRFFLA